jgi:hypothetical protein
MIDLFEKEVADDNKVYEIGAGKVRAMKVSQMLVRILWKKGREVENRGQGSSTCP